MKGIEQQNGRHCSVQHSSREVSSFLHAYRKCLLISALIFLALSLCSIIVLVPISLHHKKHEALYQSLSSFCKSTRYPDICFSSLSYVNGVKTTQKELLVEAIKVAMHGVSGMLNLTLKYKDSQGHDLDAHAALVDCGDLLDSSYDELDDSLRQVTHLDYGSYNSQITDVQTWMSASLTYHTSCTDELQQNLQGEAGQILQKKGLNVAKLLSNALSIVNSFATNPQRRLLSTQSNSTQLAPGNGNVLKDHIPSWLSMSDLWALRRHHRPRPNVVVAQDGTGNFQRIQDAINAAPINSKKRYVIYIKQGIYREVVDVNIQKTNLMLVGDGRGKTIITGSRSVMQPGVTTRTSAIVGIDGRGFLARDLTIENTAGPYAQQAVALRVGADQSAFWRCSFLGYQDTLLAHVFRQFYRDCIIVGTVDFVFGNAAAVFQKCTLLSRKPLSGQQTVVAAQGRTDPAQSTGFSFHMCTVGGSSRIFLGRPWKEFSRVVWLRSNLLGVVAPSGWLRWEGSRFGIGTVYFGEYMNSGPGSGLAKRVKWSTSITRVDIAFQFTLRKFIDGNMWLPSTNFAFDEGL